MSIPPRKRYCLGEAVTLKNSKPHRYTVYSVPVWIEGDYLHFVNGWTAHREACWPTAARATTEEGSNE